jgi:CRP-like cAMP-binding protein
MRCCSNLTMKWHDWIGNLSYVLFALSYMVTNMAWLRVLAMGGLVAEGAYFYLASATPLWVGVGWALVFVAINATQLFVLLRERVSVRLSAEERRLHAGVFSVLSAVEFHRMLRAGTWRSFPAGSVLTRVGQPVRQVHLLASGTASVVVNDTHVATISAGGIVGEMSFLSGRPATATVAVAEAARVFEIEQEALARLLEEHQDMRAPLLRAIGGELLEKINSLRTEFTKGGAN